MMRAQTAHEKQGDLGDLQQKTKAELLDLLSRQEKLLANKKFLNQLKDKGAKVESFAEKLRTLIAEREEVERTIQLFQRIDLGTEDNPMRDVSERTHQPQGFTGDGAISANERENIEPSTVNKQRTWEEVGKHDRKFKPNRDLKSTAVPDDFPRPIANPSPSKDQGSREKSMDRHTDVELSAVAIPPLRNQEAQVVEMAESASLLQEQKKNAEALLAKQAAERLSERLHVKMDDFLPQIHAASYRSQNDESEEDSTESDEDNDATGEEDEELEDS